jgi:AcrR family transcriptional regulator
MTENPMMLRHTSMDKKDAILTAALELFAERGYHGTSVGDIAQRANVGAGTIYRYFKDKVALVNALYQICKREMMAAVLTDLPRDVPARQIFRELWKRLAQFAESRRPDLPGSASPRGILGSDEPRSDGLVHGPVS